MNELRILVAEDNATYRKLICAMLEKLTGRIPESASNGVEALDQITRTPFDLVFMDNHMPGMSGVEVTRNVRLTLSTDSQPKIVAVSGSSSGHDVQDFDNAGIDAHLAKPFRMADLVCCIEGIVSSVYA